MRGGTELPVIVMVTSIFTVMDQRPTAVTAERGFSHSFHCTPNERNRTAVEPYYQLEAWSGMDLPLEGPIPNVQRGAPWQPTRYSSGPAGPAQVRSPL